MRDTPLLICRDILLRLPAESLFRLRAVSKRWRTIIDDPCFVKAHNKNQQSSNTIILRNTVGPPFYPLYYFDLEALNFTNGPKTIPATSINLSRNGWSLVRSVPLAACNGLMLISPLDHRKSYGGQPITRDTEGIWEIWNPLTHERLRLPQLSNHSHLANVHSHVLGYGIGYDCAGDDYKVVVIDFLYYYDNQESLLHIDVYSLKSDSWRTMIEDCPFDYLTPHCLKGVFLNGALHWILGTTTDCMIIAFDIGTEKYSFELKPPDNLSQMRGPRLLQLDGFGECLFLSCKDEDPHQLDAWVMNGYGAEGSWIHLFSIKNINYNVTRLVAYLKNKKQVLLQHYYGFLWFDVESCNSMKIVGVHGLFGDFNLCAQHFIGSLVRLHDRCGSVADKRRMRKSKGKMKMEMVDTELTFCVRDYGDDCDADHGFPYPSHHRCYSWPSVGGE